MRLIDADQLIKLLETNEELYGYLSCDDIQNSPTVEARPVIHAHWERYTGFDRCSHCKTCVSFGMAYCERCGATMDEEDVIMYDEE